MRGAARPPERVVTCYAVFDKFFPTTGLLDYTEGIYDNDPDTPFEVAQRRQIDYLLDEVRCGPGTQILDLGCGNGTLLDAVRERGGVGVGITIVPEQVAVCRARGLDARLVDLRAMDSSWDGRFDAIVANGPIEHFVQLEDAVAGRADAIYREMFQTMHRLIDPDSPVRRVVNTTVHFARTPSDPFTLTRSILTLKPFSDDFHYLLLNRSFGGYYPVPGQLQRCAQGWFDLVREVEATRDYYFTSEAWLKRIREALVSPTLFTIARRAAPLLVRKPKQFVAMVVCMLVTESWNWQFRSEDPPARLYRQTWAWVPR